MQAFVWPYGALEGLFDEHRHGYALMPNLYCGYHAVIV